MSIKDWNIGVPWDDWNKSGGTIKTGKSTSDGITILDGKPNLFDNILYFDNKYLIIQFEKKIRCYELKENGKKIDIELDGVTTSINGERVKLKELPNEIKTKVAREKL